MGGAVTRVKRGCSPPQDEGTVWARQREIKGEREIGQLRASTVKAWLLVTVTRYCAVRAHASTQGGVTRKGTETAREHAREPALKGERRTSEELTGS